MDSKIRDAEDDILFGQEKQKTLREKGQLTTLTGYNHEHDSQVEYMHKPGDPAEDDHFLKKIFKNHYTLNKKGEKVLTKNNALLASKDVVKQWNHMSDDEAE